MVTGERACSTRIAARTRRPAGPGSLFSASRGGSTTECSIGRATNMLSPAAGLRWSRPYIPTACSGGCSGLGISRERPRQTRPRSTASARCCLQAARSTRLRNDWSDLQRVVRFRLRATAQSRVVRYCLTLPELDKTLLIEAATFVRRHADGAGLGAIACVPKHCDARERTLGGVRVELV